MLREISPKRLKHKFQKKDGRVVKVKDSAVFEEVTQPASAFGKLSKLGWGLKLQDAYNTYLRRSNIRIPVRFARISNVADLQIYKAVKKKRYWQFL